MATKSSKKHILIIGAGLSGCLMAINFAKAGHNVQVIEARPDMRKNGFSGGRSINMALSHRGIRALARVGVSDLILQSAVAMKGRRMHAINGETHFMPYSEKPSEYINSISRAKLNEQLMQLADSYDNVEFIFNERCVKADLEKGTVATFSLERGTEELRYFQGDHLIGADGANSALRGTFRWALPTFTEDKQRENYGYKELTIYPDEVGVFKMDKNALHIWARGAFMMIALPNEDATFTCTVFLPLADAPYSLEALDEEEKVNSFFETYFPDAKALLPDLYEQWSKNPIGTLGTVRCAPYTYKDKAVLLGDAAHAMVPFYGQGMNAAFEDCWYLMEYLEQYDNDWSKALEAYEASQKPNGDAIAQLALENFLEMRDSVANQVFIKKRQVELALERNFSDYYSKYALVTFHPDISYKEAHRRGNLQDEFLMAYCAENLDVSLEAIDLKGLYASIKKIV